MSAPSCPDRARLQSLLAGTSENGEHAALIGHLDECPSCRRALEELAGAADVSATALSELEQPSHGDEPKLAGALDALKATPPEEQPRRELDFALDFLEPSDDPAHLGRFASYEITEELGRGGHGVVLKGFDPALHRVVAIKVLAPALASNGTARKRFDREARAAAAVSHDHVVTIHAVAEWRRLPYLVMQYVAGMSLEEKIHREGPLEVKEILRIGMQIASGLAAAHAQGNVHRDIKPSNILLENGVERVKITDFGLARAMDDAALTQSGVVAGTPQYMAPEQARGEPLDHRADLFSLGSVLYAMCTGRPPFRTDTTMAVLRKVSDETPTPIRQINADVPDWLAEIVTRLHAKDPDQRYQTAAEVAGVLGRHLEQLQHPSLVSSPPYQGGAGGVPAVERPTMTQPNSGRATTRGSAETKPGRTRWLAAAAVVLVALALGITEATGVTEVTDLVATVLRIRTPEGTLVVEVDDPAIEVTVEDGGKAITLTGAGPHTIRLTPGSHQIKASRDGQPLSTQWVTVTRGDRQVVSVSLEAVQAGTSPSDGVPAMGIGQRTPSPDHYPRVHARTVRLPIATLLGPLDGVGAVAISGDGKLLAGYCADELVIVWDLQTHTLVRTIEAGTKLAGPRHGFVARFLPDCRRLVLASRGGPDYVAVYDAGSGELQNDLWSGGFECVAVSSDGETVAAGSRGGDVRLVKLADINRNLRLHEAPGATRPGVVRALGFSPDDKLLAAVRSNSDQADVPCEITIYDMSTMKPINRVMNPGRINAVCFSPDGALLAAAGMATAKVAGLTLWSVADAKPIEADPPAGELLDVAFSPDGHLFAAGQEVVTVWPLSEPQPGGHGGGGRPRRYRRHFELRGHSGPVNSIALTPDGKLLATGGSDGTVKLWDVASLNPETIDDVARAEAAGDDTEDASPAAGESASPIRARFDDEEALDTLIKTFTDAFNRGDAEGVAALYDEEADYINAAGEELKGREAVEREYAAFFALNPGAKVKIEVESRTHVGSDVVVEDGTWQLTDVLLPFKGSYESCVIKRDGRWLIRRDRALLGALGRADDSEAGDVAGPVRRLPAWRRHIEDGLDKRVDVDFDNAKFGEIVPWLREQLDANVIVDRRALEERAVPLNSTFTLQLTNVPLKLVLAELLEPVKVDYLLRNEALVLTSRHATDEFLEAQVYNVAHLLPAVGPGGKAPFDPEYWEDLITNVVEPDSWSEVGRRLQNRRRPRAADHLANPAHPPPNREAARGHEGGARTRRSARSSRGRGDQSTHCG